jgi:ornithine cyclodeaminase/alanine dehydrogenase-like protein (mu-crystallin family)
MREMKYSEIVSSLTKTFLNQNDYFFDKHVPEFIKDDVFLGDYFNQLAVEPRGDMPPRFYHTFSPFDVISNKAPHHAVVFENGKIVLNIDFDIYVALRTAAMSAVLLKAMGYDSLKNKNVLLFGSGRIAQQSVKILASELDMKSVDVITRSNDLSGIKAAVDNVSIENGSIDEITKYDIIICHTKTTSPVIEKKQLEKIKKGAVLLSFISSTDHGELPDEVYDSSKANVITDWQQTISGAKDLKRAVESNLLSEENLIYIKDLLSGSKINQEKQYTVYRSTGTPIQNLAVLKLIVG